MQVGRVANVVQRCNIGAIMGELGESERIRSATAGSERIASALRALAADLVA